MRRAVLLALLVTGCAQILDLEDREFVDDAGAPMLDGSQMMTIDGALAGDAATSLACDQYCKDALELCPAGDEGKGVQIFELATQCASVCARYPVGDPANPVGNTLACRADLLSKARRFGEAATICQAAGPSGSAFQSGGSCGTDCESFCNLRRTVCGENDPMCMARCAAIPDNQATSYNAKVDFASGKDSFNCRMAHLVTAAAYLDDNDLKSRDDHCGHSGYLSTAPCDLAAKDKASCADYCKVVTNACTGDFSVYADQAQCEAWCLKLPNAEMDSKMDNTVRCRRVGAYAVLVGTPSERGCEAAGPVPLECGGSKCAPFCSLLLSTCGTEVFKTQQECVTSCEMIPDSKLNAPINLKNSNRAPPANNDTLSCRVANLMIAVGGDLRACTNALGTGNCK